MPIDLEEQKSKIEKKKQKLLAQQRAIKDKQKRMQQKVLAKIGIIAKRAKIDELDEEALLGAFLEIAEQISDAKKTQWKKIALKFLENTNEKSDEVLIISFNTTPEKNAIELLKNLGFKFNKFRNEYYGQANRKSLEKELQGSDYKIEVFED